MQISYNSKTMEDYAGQLYREANSIIRGYAFGFFVIGAMFGGGLWFLAVQLAAKSGKFSAPSMEYMWIAIAVCAVISGFSGYMRGKAKAFRFALEAQQTLCQVQIEHHLRNILKRLEAQNDPKSSSKS